MARFVLDTYGEDQTIGYDIGCVFAGTLKRSSFGDEATRRSLQIIVDAFHCWAHNRTCQCVYHPLYNPKLGLEDFATNERLFSVLNACARVTRHMSNYRWKQTIHMQVRQINEERYESSGKLDGYLQCSRTKLSLSANFIYGNIKQAISIINDYSAELDVFTVDGQPITDSTFPAYLAEELRFLRTAVRKEPWEKTMRVHYAEALHKFWKQECAARFDYHHYLLRLCA